MDMPPDMWIDVWNSAWCCMVLHVRYMLFSILHDFLFMTQIFMRALNDGVSEMNAFLI
jgi:hypothetical protein